MSRPAARWPGPPGHAPGDHPRPRLEPAYGPGGLDLADRGSPAARPSPPRSTPGPLRLGRSQQRRRSAARTGPCRTAPGKRRSPRTATRPRSASSSTSSTGLRSPAGSAADGRPPRELHPRHESADDGEGDAGLCKRPGTSAWKYPDRHHRRRPDRHHRLPARDIAELYGMRSAVGSSTWKKSRPYPAAAHHRRHPRRCLPHGRRHRRRPPGAAGHRRQHRRRHRRRRPDQRHRAPQRGHRQHRRRAGRHCGHPGRGHRDHPPRHHRAPAAVRHRLAARRRYPRFTIKKVRARKSNDVVPAAPSCTCSPARDARIAAAERPAGRLTSRPAARPGTRRAGIPACPGHRGHGQPGRSRALRDAIPGRHTPISRNVMDRPAQKPPRTTERPRNVTGPGTPRRTPPGPIHNRSISASRPSTRSRTTPSRPRASTTCAAGRPRSAGPPSGST